MEYHSPSQHRKSLLNLQGYISKHRHPHNSHSDFAPCFRGLLWNPVQGNVTPDDLLWVNTQQPKWPPMGPWASPSSEVLRTCLINICQEQFNLNWSCLGKQDGLDDLVSFPGRSYAILVKAQREKPDSNPNPGDDFLFVFAIITGFSDCSTC